MNKLCVFVEGGVIWRMVFKNELGVSNIYIQHEIKPIKLIVILLWLGKQNELNWRSQNWSSGSDSMYAAKNKKCLLLTCICLELNLKWGGGEVGRKGWETFHWFQSVLTQILVPFPSSRKTLSCKLRRTRSYLLPFHQYRVSGACYNMSRNKQSHWSLWAISLLSKCCLSQMEL